MRELFGKIKKRIHESIELYNDKNVMNAIAKDNTRSLRVYVYITALIYIILFILSFLAVEAESGKYFYLLHLGLLAITYLFSKKYSNTYRIQIFIYIYIITQYAFVIEMGTFLMPNAAAVTFPTLLVLMPILYILNPIIVDMITLIAVVVFVVTAVLVKEPDLVGNDIFEATLFGLISIAVSFYINTTKIRGKYLKITNDYLSNVDKLTGLLNRNRFETSVNQVQHRAKRKVACIYIDVNGLHELNNKEGHKAGDTMLITIAKIVQSIFGEKYSYRIGGDEYVSILLDTEKEELDLLVSKCKTEVEKRGYHVAIGAKVAGKADCSMAELIKDAEILMYKDKAEYYKTRDRRARK